MIVRCYYIWPRFPSISLSGSRCALSCAHCNRHYLSCMIPAETPEALLSGAKRLEASGARGLLLSGGCDGEGKMLNLPRLLPTIRKLKRETDLILKLHTGFVDRDLAEGIHGAEVDVASMEFVGARESIREVFGLPFGVDRYVETFRNLADAGIRYISPHICVGLHHGHLLGEFEALHLLRETIDPESIAIIVFRPTQGTPMGSLLAPSPSSVGRVVAHARKLFPGKKILLGSLRPRLSGKDGSPHPQEAGTGVPGMRVLATCATASAPRSSTALTSPFSTALTSPSSTALTSPSSTALTSPSSTALTFPFSTVPASPPGSRLEMELAALNNGADAVEIPSPGLVSVMKARGCRIKRIEAFGILPESYESRVGFRWERDR